MPRRTVWMGRSASHKQKQGGIHVRDQDLVRLLQKDPDSGLQAALRGYGPLIKAVLVRILPRDPRDVEE